MQGGARSVSGRDKIEVLRQVLKIVTHPATIIAGVVSGLLFGFFLPKPAHALVPFAKLYVALLSMSMLPILVTALTWGIGQMLRTETTRALFPRMAFVLSAAAAHSSRGGGAGMRRSQPGRKPRRERCRGARPAARQ